VAPRAPVKTAFVTGAASGLGLELCRVLLARGYRVAMFSRDAEPLRLAALALGGGDRLLPLTGDVTDAARVREAVAQTCAQWGGLDLAIANAGLRGATWAADFRAEDARRLMETNYLGMLHLLDAVLPGMLARGAGSFAAVASLAGLRALPGGAGYGASKAAIQAFLDSMRPELEPRGVRLHTVNPWFMRTAGKDDGVPRPLVVEPDWAAHRIVDGIEAGRRRIEFHALAAFLWRIVRLLPDGLFVALFRPRGASASWGLRAMRLAGRPGRRRRPD
jgi:NADP-dependent 3-hydroxy acid dehydrogenase YdfG